MVEFWSGRKQMVPGPTEALCWWIEMWRGSFITLIYRYARMKSTQWSYREPRVSILYRGGKQYLRKMANYGLCGTMRNASAWTSLMPWVACSHLACVIVCRHIGSGAAHWLPWEPLNIPRQVPEMAIKRNFTSFFFSFRDFQPLLSLRLCS